VDPQPYCTITGDRSSPAAGKARWLCLHPRAPSARRCAAGSACQQLGLCGLHREGGSGKQRADCYSRPGFSCCCTPACLQHAECAKQGANPTCWKPCGNPGGLRPPTWPVRIPGWLATTATGSQQTPGNASRASAPSTRQSSRKAPYDCCCSWHTTGLSLTGPPLRICESLGLWEGGERPVSVLCATPLHPRASHMGIEAGERRGGSTECRGVVGSQSQQQQQGSRGATEHRCPKAWPACLTYPRSLAPWPRAAARLCVGKRLCCQSVRCMPRNRWIGTAHGHMLLPVGRSAAVVLLPCCMQVCRPRNEFTRGPPQPCTPHAGS
jgi:hypothetical protein